MLKFKNLLESGYKIKIPPYQRAYAWGEEQINNFLKDLNDIKLRSYYYGHFIIEENKEKKIYEIIDGQQRITTYVLFLLSAKLYLGHEINANQKDFVRNKFIPIDFDIEKFNEIVESILEEKRLINPNNDDTSSIKRIIKAFSFFEAFFKNNENYNISETINCLESALISTYLTEDKSIAVQIFELQNTRGVKLDLIEKIKSKLMKELFLNISEYEVNKSINIVQKNFSDIYRLEEKTMDNSFRGEFTLNHILFHHLRVIDDGTKKEYKDLNLPSNGNIENSVLSYLSKRLSDLNSSEKVSYVIKLSNLFSLSVKYLCDDLIKLDRENPIIGDCVILDKSNSIELFLILFHKNKFNEMIPLLKKWELFLFIRDFHNKYFNKSKKDNFQGLYGRILKNECIETVLNNYLEFGFRGYNDKYKLQEVYANYISDSKDIIQKNAFNFHPWKEKITYLLYKFEISQDINVRPMLREIFKNKKTLDHILPQNWGSHWVTIFEVDKKEKFRNSINSKINGIGNLIIVTQSENSTLSNKHPRDKEYHIKEFGSYKTHFENNNKWANHENWETLIDERGKCLYEFLLDYFKDN